MAETVYGYEVRDIFPSERDYVNKNPNVGGMATEDKKIILNPYTSFTDQEKQSIIKNEAIRLWLKDRNIVPDFDLTPEQKAKFSGTPYEKDELALKHSIISRILSGDPSAGTITPSQKQWADDILLQLEKSKKPESLGDAINEIQNNRRIR